MAATRQPWASALHAAAEISVDDSSQHEDRAFDAADFAQRDRQFALTRISGEFSQDFTGRDRACERAGGQTQNIGSALRD